MLINVKNMFPFEGNKLMISNLIFELNEPWKVFPFYIEKYTTF